jgi:predicted GTPase
MTSNVNELYRTNTTTETKPTNLSHNTAGRLIEIKKQFLEILNSIITVVTSIYNIWDQVDHAETLATIQTIIDGLNSDYSNVEHLELRMCVVAPMKAGKSTIINAILGQNILPARNAAMTVIPTEVMLQVAKSDGTVQEPTLVMDEELITQIRAMQQKVRSNLATSQTLEDLKRKLPEHTHLVSTAEEIRDSVGDGRTFEGRTTGTQHIRTTLQYVNDVIRLHEILMPTEGFASSRHLVRKLPRITAPYNNLGDESVVHESLGNLVIVDTPGPNEDTTTNFLKEIIIQELKNAVVILVVLDYTALNTEADKIVKTEIMNIRQASSSKDDSLFALVNKVDRRRQGDMSPAEVHDLVRNKFNIGEASSDYQTTSRVFEVQALRALLAKQFSTDVNSMDRSEPFIIRDLKSGPDFLAEAYGAAYDDDDPPTIEKAKADAMKLWNKSGFGAFLQGSIEKLIERAAPRAIESALNHCQSNLHGLHEILTIREKLLCANEEALLLQINALVADMQKVRNVMEEQWIALQQEQTTMTTRFRTQFTQIKEHAVSQLEVFDERFRSEGIYQSAYVDVPGKTATDFLSAVFVRSPIHDVMWRLAMALRDRAYSDGVFKFENELDGRRFTRNIERQIRNISEKALIKIRDEVDRECDLACARLNQHLQKNTKDILAAAQNRLANAFDIQFRKPPSFKPAYATSNDFELKLQKTYSPWWLFNVFSIPYEEGYITGTTYQIRMSSLKTYCINLLHAQMNAIETELSRYLTDVLQDNFTRHFKELENYLARYRDYVNKSLHDQARTIDEKVELKVLLLDLVKQIDDKSKALTDIHEFFESHAYSTSVDVE